MKQYWTSAGLLLNSAVITVNRFFLTLPEWLSLSCLILGIALILIGAVVSKK